MKKNSNLIKHVNANLKSSSVHGKGVFTDKDIPKGTYFTIDDHYHFINDLAYESESIGYQKYAKIVKENDTYLISQDICNYILEKRLVKYIKHEYKVNENIFIIFKDRKYLLIDQQSEHNLKECNLIDKFRKECKYIRLAYYIFGDSEIVKIPFNTKSADTFYGSDFIVSNDIKFYMKELLNHMIFKKS